MFSPHLRAHYGNNYCSTCLIVLRLSSTGPESKASRVIFSHKIASLAKKSSSLRIASFTATRPQLRRRHTPLPHPSHPPVLSGCLRLQNTKLRDRPLTSIACRYNNSTHLLLLSLSLFSYKLNKKTTKLSHTLSHNTHVL